MAIPVTFTMADVREAGSADPWKIQDDFFSEVDPADIAEAATSYVHAAGEASGAEELARLASEEHAEAGEWQHESLADVEERLSATSGSLATPELETAVEILGKVLTLAEDALSDISDEISGQEGVNLKILDHSRNSFEEFNAWHGSLVSARQALGDSAYEVGVDVIVPPPGESRTPGLPDPVIAYENANGFLEIPGSVRTAIREYHLGKAVDDANAAAEVIDDLIDDYRSSLTSYGSELAEAGYDLSASPLGVWNTPEMGVYHAEQVREAADALREDPDDATALNTLDSIATIMASATSDIFNADGSINRQMTAAERDYLHAVFGRLSSDDIVALGELGLEDGNFYAALANGAHALSNPQAGGLDPMGGDGLSTEGEWLPESLRDLVYYDPFDDERPGGYSDHELLERFDAFGAVMQHATVPAGSDFSMNMAKTAVDMQLLANHQGIDELGNPNSSFVGSSGMLAAASLNGAAAATVMGNEDFVERMLALEWSDSSGVGSFVTSGTIPPPGVDPESVESRKWFNAAFNVLTNSGRAEGSWEGVDHEGLHLAIGETAMSYMDFISRSGGGADASEMNNDGHSVHGVDYATAFFLSKSDREDLFNLMNQSTDEVRDQFRGGVALWQHEVARGGLGTNDIGNRMESVGTVEGFISASDIEAAKNGFSPEKLVSSSLAASGLVMTLAGGGPVATALHATGTFAVSEAMKYANITPPEAAEIAELVREGPVSARIAVADAAIQHAKAEDPTSPLAQMELPSLEEGDSFELDRVRQELSKIEKEAGYDTAPLHREFDSSWMN